MDVAMEYDLDVDVALDMIQMLLWTRESELMTNDELWYKRHFR